jgi:hypothetical protein
MKYTGLAKRFPLLLAVSVFTMWGLVTSIITQAQDELGGGFKENDNEQVSFQSVRAVNARSGEVVVVDSVRNKEPDAATFSWADAAGRFTFAGWLPPAQKKGKQTIPKTLTQKWNTFRRVDEGDARVEWVSENKGRSGVTRGPTSHWVAVGGGRDVKQEAKLYGLLIDGEENKGKTLFECSSVVRKKADDSYRYTYTVVNSSRLPLHFEWAGFSQKLAPGKSFEKTIESKKLTKERSGAAKAKFHRGDPTKVPPIEYIITSPYWEIPQE